MAFIPVPNAVEMVLLQAMLGQVINNVLGFDFPDTPDTIDLTTLASAAISSWIDNMAIRLSSDLDLNGVKATSLQSDSAPTVTVAAPVGTDGDIAGASQPLNVAVVVSERTLNRGRSYRGRYYQAGTSVAGAANVGSITSVYLADLLASYAAFIDDIELATGATHGVISRYNNNAPRTTGVITPITGYSGNADYDSQRRRLLGRGT